MKILMYGGKGWIGTQFCQYMSTNHPEHKMILGDARVEELSEVEEEINRISPTNVVCFIGRTSGVHDGKAITTIDFLEKPGRLVDNIRDNLFSPVVLAILCSKRNIHLTYLGTGCIFDRTGALDGSEDGEGFTEDDSPNYFGSGYSIVKGFTDQMMTLFKDSVLNLRIRMPISDQPSGRNFIDKITKYEKICSLPNSMSVLPNFFPIFTDMMEKRKSGTYNCTNPGTITHNEILEMYKELVNPEFRWKNFTIEEQNQILLAKRSNNKLNTDKIKAEYPQLPPIEEAVREVLQSYGNNL